MSARRRPERILVIRYGPLVELAQALPALVQIRRGHPEAEITLLCTPSLEAFARGSGLFDTVWTTGHPKNLAAYLALVVRLRRGRFQRVYDFQGSSDSAKLHRALLPLPPTWIGAAPDRKTPALQRYWRLAVQAGFAESSETPPRPDLAWTRQTGAHADQSRCERLGLKSPYALIAPGPFPGRPRARWPTKSYAGLAGALVDIGITPAVVGGQQEASLAEAIQRHVSDTVVLTGQVNSLELAGLATEAALAVGVNPATPLLAALAGAPAVLMLPSDLLPAELPEPDERVAVLQRDDLADLHPVEVLKACRELLGHA